ncbi:MAG: hypothetical protein JWN90_448 [Parcubacteria group bacterium]|nr:hypothetical protein [Parcubacteria group bacterium]
MKDFVHNLKQKPEHVRKRIVLGTTSAVTGLVAIAWVGTMAATGAFSLSTTGTLAAGNAAQPQAALADTAPSSFSQLAGAVAAVTGATTSAPALTIVDGESTSTFDKQQASPTSNSATVLSF